MIPDLLVALMVGLAVGYELGWWARRREVEWWQQSARRWQRWYKVAFERLYPDMAEESDADAVERLLRETEEP